MARKNASDTRPLGNTTTTDLIFDLVPFAEGTSREAFRATVDRDGCYMGFTGGTKLVLKTFKVDYYRKGLRVSEEDVQMQNRVRELAEQFNDEEGILTYGQPTRIHVRVARLDSFNRDIYYRKRRVFLKRERYLLEQEIHGTFRKFNSNSGWSSGDSMMDAFSHWTWHITRSMIVCDLQGVRGGDGEPSFGGNRERYYYLLTDPAINSKDKRYGVSDLGWKGIQNFFSHHVCNHLCDKSWHRPRGCRHFQVKQESSYDSLLGISRPGSRQQVSTLAPFVEEEERSSYSDESSEYDSNIISLSPKNIFFTHDSINNTFSCGRYIRDTLDDLLDGYIAVRDIPMMMVTKRDGKYWTYTGNRRLWVFRKLCDAHKLKKVDVKVTDMNVRPKHFTTVNGGRSVRVRGE